MRDRTLSLIGALLVMCPGAARGQEPPAAAQAPTPVAAPAPLPATLDLGRVDFGFRGSNVSGDAARYNRYQDLSEGALLDRFRFEKGGVFWLGEDPTRPAQDWDAAFPRCAAWARLVDVRDGAPLRYRCQTGHGYTAKQVEAEQEGAIDEAMRIALRVIDERAELVARMGLDAARAGRKHAAEMYRDRASEYRDQAETIRRAVLSRTGPPLAAE